MIWSAISLAAMQAASPSAGPSELSNAEAAQIIAQCGTRRFETSARMEQQGKTRNAKILLCAKPGQSTAEWIATLEKASVDVMKSKQLGSDAKQKLIGELNAEIAKLRAASN